MKKRNKLTLIGVGGILLLFIGSMMLPSLQIFAKIGALLIYAGISGTQIMELKKQGEEYEKSLLFSVVVVFVIAYLMFFV